MSAVDTPTVVDLRGQLPHEQESNLLAAFDALPAGASVTLLSDGLLGLLHMRLDEVRPGQAHWSAGATADSGGTTAHLRRVRTAR
jgi:uncharacterized protein (DUF2249 family)